MDHRFSSLQRRSAVHRTWRFARLTACLCVGLTLAACSDEPERKHAIPVPAESVPTIHQMARIGRAGDVEPEQWLASREAGRDLAKDDPSVARLKETMTAAERNFREYPRMIANRAVQLEEMLSGNNADERAPQLIARLSEVAGGERYVDSFGALCQQYFHLRKQGFGPDEALEVLKRGGAASN